MHVTSFILSILLHGAVVIVFLLIGLGSNIKVDLHKKVYNVELVRLPQRTVKTQSRPKSQTIPVKKAAPKAKPQKQVSPSKAVPLPKTSPAQKIKKISSNKIKNPNKVKKVPKKATAKVKPRPEPKVSKQDILAQAMGSVQEMAKKQAISSKKQLQKELASLAQSSVSNAATGTVSGRAVLVEIYAAQAKSLVKENWRFPRLGIQQLSATVRVKLGGDGKILYYNLLSSSGRQDFDASILKAVDETKFFPRPPEADIDELEITFNLSDLG